MTADPARRACRALAAAQATHLAGAPEAATRLAAIARAGPLDELDRARVDLVRAQIAFASSRTPEARVLLLRAARRLEPLNVVLSRETYLDALVAACMAGGLARIGTLQEVSTWALSAPRPSGAARAPDLLVDALATRSIMGYTAAVPMMRRAARAFTAVDLSEQEAFRWTWVAGYAALDLWDDETFAVLGARHLQDAREAGAVFVLAMALGIRALVHLFAGELEAVSELVAEQQQVDVVTGRHPTRYAAVVEAAWRGSEAECVELAETITGEVRARGEGCGQTITQWARAVLYNGLGRYDQALAAAERAGEHEIVGFSNQVLPELVLAAVRSGDVIRAAEGLARLSETAHASGTEWALGVEAGSRALLSQGDAAERLYREAIEHLGRTRIRVELARAHLRYGEWLRRERRRQDARQHLRAAFHMLDAMGVEAFAQRAQCELLATGERARRRQGTIREQLTPQETQVARLARDGLSNPEIGARLFISRRTAEYHLHKVFAKLQITSRNQLDRVLPHEPSPALAV
jgi:DNA-binding CsgD family transcriptional regulator